MYRVVSAALAAAALAGCSMGASSLSSGFASSEEKSVFAKPAERATAKSVASNALGGEPTKSNANVTPSGQRIAKLDDRVPQKSFEKAPPGALADRDYSGTKLEAETARDLINAYRKEKGLKPLKLNTVLTEAAKNHSRDLAKWDRISHFGSDGSNPWDRVKRAGYNAKLAAENVGTGQASIQEVFKGWQESPGHNKNLLLPDAEHMGIALVQDPKTEFKTFWTLVIGSSL